MTLGPTQKKTGHLQETSKNPGSKKRPEGRLTQPKTGYQEENSPPSPGLKKGIGAEPVDTAALRRTDRTAEIKTIDLENEVKTIEE